MEQTKQKNITLTMEKGTGLPRKLTAEIPQEKLEQEIAMYFYWRGENLIGRLYKQATVEYDRFIKYLVGKGYEKVE